MTIMHRFYMNHSKGQENKNYQYTYYIYSAVPTNKDLREADPTLNTEQVSSVPDFRHGLRAQHSRKPPCRTVLLQIDLSKVFDIMCHPKLIKDLNNSLLPPSSLKRWFNNFFKTINSQIQEKVHIHKCQSWCAARSRHPPLPPPGVALSPSWQWWPTLTIFLWYRKKNTHLQL